MNYKEWNSGTVSKDYTYRNQIKRMLKQWKEENNLSCKCIVHHRDDNDEVKQYNEDHYELWGFNLDGTFEYGKYVIFMTQSEHASYHNAGSKHRDVKGAKNPMYGKAHSEETRQLIALKHTGLKASDETRKKLSEMHKGRKGHPHSDETKKKISESHRGTKLSDETRKKMSKSSTMSMYSEMYKEYRANGGTLKWNQYRQMIKEKENA